MITAIETGQLTPAHGHQVLRVSEEDREKAAALALANDWRNRPKTATELAQEIDNLGTWLDNAPFPKDVEVGGKSACTSCPFNSGNQGTLFDGATKGRCMMRPCFDVKLDAVTEDRHQRSLAKFKKLPDLGLHRVAEYNQTAQGLKGVLVLNDEQLKASKELMKKQPEKFGIVTSPAYQNTAPKSFVVCQDTSILPKKLRPEESGHTAQPMNGPSRASERDQFLARAVDKALTRAALAKVRLTADVLARAVAQSNVDEDIAEAVGVDINDPIPGLKKLSVETLTKMLVLSADTMSWNGPTRANTFGVDVKAVTKQAAKVAGAEFDAKQKTDAKEKKKA